MLCSQCRTRSATLAPVKYYNPKTRESFEIRSEYCGQACEIIHTQHLDLPLAVQKIKAA